jgi:hypothetical protein
MRPVYPKLHTYLRRRANTFRSTHTSARSLMQMQPTSDDLKLRNCENWTWRVWYIYMWSDGLFM